MSHGGHRDPRSHLDQLGFYAFLLEKSLRLGDPERQDRHSPAGISDPDSVGFYRGLCQLLGTKAEATSSTGTNIPSERAGDDLYHGFSLDFLSYLHGYRRHQNRNFLAIEKSVTASGSRGLSVKPLSMALSITSLILSRSTIPLGLSEGTNLR